MASMQTCGEESRKYEHTDDRESSEESTTSTCSGVTRIGHGFERSMITFLRLGEQEGPGVT